MKRLGLLIILLLTIFSCTKESPIKSENMTDVFYIRRGGSDMPVWVHGNGASNVVIIQLHGGPGGNSLIYRELSSYKKLEQNYAIAYWDQRHQGNSHGTLDDDEVSVDILVNDLDFLVRTLKKRYGNATKLFLMGHSWGGTLGSLYLIKKNNPSAIKGWIETDGAHDIKKISIEVIKTLNELGGQEIVKNNNTSFWFEAIDYTKTVDTTAITNDNFIRLNQYAHKGETYLSVLKEPEPIDGLNYLFLSPHNSINTTLSQLMLPKGFSNGEFPALAFTNDLEKITVPTLIQWGKYDIVIPVSTGYEAFNKIGAKHKTLKIYEESAHSPMINQPNLFAQDVIDFVEEFK